MDVKPTNGSKKTVRCKKTIIVSRFAGTDRVKETMKLGANRYLKRPLILEELGRALKETLPE